MNCKGNHAKCIQPKKEEENQTNKRREKNDYDFVVLYLFYSRFPVFLFMCFIHHLVSFTISILLLTNIGYQNIYRFVFIISFILKKKSAVELNGKEMMK